MCSERNETIFEKLAMIGIAVPLKDRYFLYFACFDFESYFDSANLPNHGSEITFEARHISLSFAIFSNVPEFQDGVCHVTDGGERDLICKMVSGRNFRSSLYSPEKEV